MRILIDECVNAGVKAAFSGHAVKTVPEVGRSGTKDPGLLEYAQNRFDVFVTIDGRLERQHDLTKLKLGFVIVHVPNNEIRSYQPIFAAMRKAAVCVRPGQVIHVRAGEPGGSR